MPPLALVTGSCRRLGAHIAARLATAGYGIALHSGHEAVLERWLADRLVGVPHQLFIADLAEESAVTDLPARVTAHFGQPITLLVNNASRFAALDADGAAFAEVMAHVGVNLAAPYALALAVAQGAGAGGAAVVNILDQRILNPPIDQQAYTLSKQALGEATRTLARALAPHVRVNAVAPGLVIPTDDYAPEQMEGLFAMMPLARLATPDEVADAVAWLAAAGAVTGQTIFVDGGAHLESFRRDFVHLAR
ncbi:NAD(P)-dependent dehydrogenase, short-chain alcohol dehydrogenase family [Sphingomonas guangdongensis]|uniref:NAD(P)-dependent dehydrogenase, short-chain alcohol dehydrogenase family n=1 Tax=Sphingomonas guangdongensis TaxID=1141890 RepID=A0A285R1E2_9SPHN|nr:SDR family oxidoreductase [Sphingomonas guangdongensis]SOB87916.1 NAD(P)-dependent dehydrogenase, short-chain alcohol dehydrogenase family [Sphingomonas guangdongensis]